VAGAIFAGGESRRMGQPKEAVPLWDNRPMLMHVIDALAPLCEKIAVVGHCRGVDLSVDSRLVHIPDRQPGLGPAAALDALMASGLSSHYLVASCDQPLLNSELLERLLTASLEAPDAAVFFKTSGGEACDPFPGLYPASLLPLVQNALKTGQYAIRKVLQEASIRWVELADEQKLSLSNCNTPESIAAVNALKMSQEVVR